MARAVEAVYQKPTIMAAGAEWYCAVTNPNCLKRAELELLALGYRAFTPKVRRWVTHARVKKAKERPILGRYLFVEVDHPYQDFDTVRRINGVETIIANNGRPSPFNRSEVEGLLHRYMAGEWDEVAQGPLPLGARIRIVESQFDNMLATITKSKGRTHVVKLLDSNTYVKLHESSVVAA